MRKALFEDSDESDSADQLPMLDDPVSRQRRLRSLRKVQLCTCAWRQQVQDSTDVVKLCFQKWVGGGLAGSGWFIKQYARRFAQFCRDVNARREKRWDLLQRGGVSMRCGEYHAWMNIGKWAGCGVRRGTYRYGSRTLSGCVWV